MFPPKRLPAGLKAVLFPPPKSPVFVGVVGLWINEINNIIINIKFPIFIYH